MNLFTSLSRVFSSRSSQQITSDDAWVSSLTTSIPALDQIKALVGGADNVLDLKVCALTRLRLELKIPASLSAAQLPAPFVALLPVSDCVIYLVAAEEISHWSV